MTLKRTMDATFLNGIANHDTVRPTLGGSGQLDLAPIIANPENIALVNEFGGFVAVKLSPGIFECHSLFVPDGRGAEVLQACREGLRYLFVQTDCQQVVTKCPADNKAAFGLARQMGFSLAFRCEKTWPAPTGEQIACDYMMLRIEKWAQKDGMADERGKWFHTRLEELTTAFGKAIPVHFEEIAHNHAVGAAALMFEAGNPFKATDFYNAWARLAAFPGIFLKSVNPVVIDMDQVIIGIVGNDMEILRCQ